MTGNQRKKDTLAAISDPQPGDHFAEFLAYHVFVVARVGPLVVYCDGSPPVKFPDGDTVSWHAQHIADFKLRFAPHDMPWVLLVSRDSKVEGWVDFFRPHIAQPPKI